MFGGPIRVDANTGWQPDDAVRPPAGARAARGRADRAAVPGPPARPAALAPGALVAADRRRRERGHDRRPRRARRRRRRGQRQAREVRRRRAGPGDARPGAGARLPDVPRLHGGDVGRRSPASAAVASLADWVDLDGNLLLADDPFDGPRASTTTAAGSSPRRPASGSTAGGLTRPRVRDRRHRHGCDSPNVRFMWTSWWTNWWTNPLLGVAAGRPTIWIHRMSSVLREGRTSSDGPHVDVRADRIPSARRTMASPCAWAEIGLEDRPSMDRTNAGERAFAAAPGHGPRSDRVRPVLPPPTARRLAGAV